MTDDTTSAAANDASDDPVLARLAVLRTATDRAQAPDALWRSIRGAHRRPVRVLRYAAAAAILVGAGFVAGLASAGTLLPAPDRRADPVRSAAFAVQRSGTALVQALDALDANAVQLSDGDRAEHREVALAALSSVIATGAAEYPRELYDLIGALPSLNLYGRPATMSGSGDARSPQVPR